MRMCCPLLTGDDEGENEAEERERFGERDAEEHRRLDLTSRLGLTGHRRDGVADDDADADAGADGRAAVGNASTDGRKTLDEFASVLGTEDRQRWKMCSSNCDSLFLVVVVSGDRGVAMARPMKTPARIVKM